jgi:hypothetical protein
MDCYAMWTRGLIPTFRRNILPPFSAIGPFHILYSICIRTSNLVFNYHGRFKIKYNKRVIYLWFI